MGPGLFTSLVFGSSLRLAGVEVEERDRFSRVTVLEDALLLMPSASLETGRRLRLRVRFVEGGRLASADFFLVMEPDRTESHQVNVDLIPPLAEHCGQQIEVERARAQQCQAELERMSQQPQGLTGLISVGLLDGAGVAAHELSSREEFNVRSGAYLLLKKLYTYRAAARVAVDLRMANSSTRPWAPKRAELVGERGERLKVLRVWSREPLAPGAMKQQVVVEAEAGRKEALGRFTLSLQESAEAPSVVVEGVSFP